MPRVALAELSSALELTWRAPPGCPDREQVRSTIERWLRESVEPVDASAIAVEAEAIRDADGWSIVLVLESPSGRAEDRLAAASCETLVEVVALKVALAASSAAALAAHQVRAPAERTVKLAARPRLRFALRAGGGVVVGRFAHVSTGLQLVGALRIDWARLELGALYGPAQSVRFRDQSEVGAEFQTFSGTARACGVPVREALELLVCLGLELGSMRGTGVGADRPSTWNLLFGEVVVGPALRWPLDYGVSAWLEIDVSVGFERPSYSVRGLGRLYRPQLAGARANFGMELEL